MTISNNGNDAKLCVTKSYETIVIYIYICTYNTHAPNNIHACFKLPVHGHIGVPLRLDVLSCLLQVLLSLLLLLLLQVSQSATRKAKTQHKHLCVTFLNYLTLGWEFERQLLTVTLIDFITFKNRSWLPQATGSEI